MPSDTLAERPASATLTVAARAHLASLAYMWEHPEDGPQEGLLVFGPGADVDSLAGLWGDSWHQQPAPMSITGSVIEDSMELGGDHEGGWRWRIVVRAVGPSALTMQMENVIPTDQTTAEMPAGAVYSDAHGSTTQVTRLDPALRQRQLRRRT